jgi:steroid 5-alpha reductase family enzyme
MVEALLLNTSVLLVLALVCWLMSVASSMVSFVDAVWGGGMVTMALTSVVQTTEPGPLALLLAGMVMVWGMRLAGAMLVRFQTKGEDPRYVRILAADRAAGRFAVAALTKVWLLQAVLLFAVCLCAQAAILSAAPGQGIGPAAWLGLALWLVGMVFEVVGDWQLANFKGDPANRGKVMDQGLWRYTRHPNYFGDACLWWGIWLASTEAGWLAAVLGLPGLAFLTFTLTKWSGAGMTEAAMAEKYGDAFADYAKRTPAFIPWFPRAP